MGLLRNALVAAVGTLRIFAVARADEWNGLRSSLSSAGDIDGDGVPDLMVASRDSTRSGVVWILSGRNGALLRTLEGARPCDGFGSSMALVGDLDGDGSPDMVVGARGTDCDHGPHEEECVPYARAYSGKDGHILYEIRTGWIVGAAGD